MTKEELKQIDKLYYDEKYKEYIDAVLKIDKKYWNIVQIGIAFCAQKRYEECVKYMTQNPDENYYLYHSVLGEAYEGIKDYDNAVKAFEIYLTLEPYSTYPWYDLCKVMKKKYKKLDDFKKAAEKYKDFKGGYDNYVNGRKEYERSKDGKKLDKMLAETLSPEQFARRKKEMRDYENIYKNFVKTNWENYFGKEIKRMEDKLLGKTKPKSIVKAFDKNYILLKDMVNDSCYPKHLVAKIVERFQKLIEFLETGERTTDEVQKKLDTLVRYINSMEEKFENADSEIETVARDSIGTTVEYILKWFNVDIDTEEAIREREW